MKKKPQPPQPRKQKSGGKQKKQYKVRNWKEYNQSLVDRGKVIFHITEEALEQWEETEKSGKRGRPKAYHDTAIETSISLQQLFQLPLRQAEGLLSVMLLKLGSSVSAPDYSTASLRGKKLAISIRVRPIAQGPIHVVVDSTGAKVFGEGEWKVRQHGWSKHRRWKKLHLGIDEKTGDILVGDATGNDVADGEMLEPLLAQLPEGTTISQCSADGAYDHRSCYESLMKRGVSTITIAPRHDAKIWRHGNRKGDPHPRDKNLRRIREIGRAAWKAESGYHRRSLVETGMFRLKVSFGDRVSARTDENQKVQLLLRCKLLNRFTMLGMPESYGVAA